MAIKSSNQITFSEQKKIVQIKEWYLATDKQSGVSRDTEGWSETMHAIDAINKYLWNYEEVIYSIGSSDLSDPILVGFYGKGEDGKGIVDIQHYYLVTQFPELPESPLWLSSVPMLSPTNKYLWNYAVYSYTDKTTKEIDPAIIGVYGDSGADAVEFQIYSNQGFIFKEGINEIELKIAAFQGTNPIVGATYTWEWWNTNVNDGDGGYSPIIENTVEQSIIISMEDQYALSHLRCVMTYNGNTYEDYADLTTETVIYSSVVKFFNGSNIFEPGSQYIIAYVDLYRNNDLIDSVLTNQYYGGNTTVTNDVITTDLDGTFEDGSLMYFIYSDAGKYRIALGEYRSQTWSVYNAPMQYAYINDIYPDVDANVIVISKNDVSKSKNINFTISKNGTNISTTNAIVLDINDPIISATEPKNANYGQLWLDTSVSPYVIKIYTKVDGEDSGVWEYFSQQNGGSVYTSQPSSYKAGDLWILDDGETCGNFGSGSMLRAISSSENFNPSHWEDATPSITATIHNIDQYFEFNKDTGLKVGQKDGKFHVNISSTKMGFHSITYNSDGSVKEDNEVVYIGTNSAIIQNATFQGGDDTTFENNAHFDKEVTFGNFVWKVESNGSLSLSVG